MAAADDAKPQTVPSRQCLRRRSAWRMGVANGAKHQVVARQQRLRLCFVLPTVEANDVKPLAVPSRPSLQQTIAMPMAAVNDVKHQAVPSRLRLRLRSV